MTTESRHLPDEQRRCRAVSQRRGQRATTVTAPPGRLWAVRECSTMTGSDSLRRLHPWSRTVHQTTAQVPLSELQLSNSRGFPPGGGPGAGLLIKCGASAVDMS